MLLQCGTQPFHQEHVLYAEEKSGKKTVRRLLPDPDFLTLSPKTTNCLALQKFAKFYITGSVIEYHNSQDSQS